MKKQYAVFSGERLEEIRKDKGYTQRELGELIGLTESAISAYEVGKVQPPASKLCQICVILDISPDYLLSFTDEEIPASRKHYIALSRDWPDELQKELENHLELLKLKYNVK